MASWDTSEALTRLRSLLNDGPADKFVFKRKTTPPPDGLTKKFFVGHTNLIPSSLAVYLDGSDLAVSGTPDYERGTFDLSNAPAVSGNLQTSYYHQWFTDAELETFLLSSAQALNFETYTTEGLAIGLRPAILAYAACEAYTAKAAQWAEALSAAVGGYQLDKTNANPNWRALADMSCKRAQSLLEQYVNNPLSTSDPAMAFVTFKLPIIQPRT